VLRQFLSQVSLFDLPLLAMGIFVAMFLAVLVRVCQRSRRAGYAQMATLPLLQDDQGRK
jgi:hypothetical protein